MLQAMPAGRARAGDTDEEDAPEPEDGPRVILRINRPTAKLQQRTMLGWRDICIPPCGAVVEPSGLFRIAGGGAVVSKSFELPRASGDVFVEGHVGSKAQRIVGIVLMVTAVVAAGYGGFFWLVDDTSSREARDIGLISIGACVLLGITGGVVASTGRTSIRVR
jgi:hypothetical protein